MAMTWFLRMGQGQIYIYIYIYIYTNRKPVHSNVCHLPLFPGYLQLKFT